MISADSFRKMALSLPEATEQPHFEKTTFRVYNKIFATMAPGHNVINVMLVPADQEVFCTFNSDTIYPIPNKWGEKGATHVNLAIVKEELLTEILKCAYKKAAPKQLANLITFG